MWPGCNQCGAPVPAIDDRFCSGNRCIGKAYKGPMIPHPAKAGNGYISVVNEKKHRKKNKQARQNRKRGRK